MAFKTLKKIKSESFPESSPVVPHLMDKRLVMRNVSRGIVSNAELKAALQSLPDDAGNAVEVSYSQVVGEDHASGKLSGPTTH